MAGNDVTVPFHWIAVKLIPIFHLCFIIIIICLFYGSMASAGSSSMMGLSNL